jgi:hypothetical protein
MRLAIILLALLWCVGPAICAAPQTYPVPEQVQSMPSMQPTQPMQPPPAPAPDSQMQPEKYAPADSQIQMQKYAPAPPGPQYPYPPYHNPYYTGSSGKDLFSDTIDFFAKMPYAVMHRLSDLVNKRVYKTPPLVQTNQVPRPAPSAPVEQSIAPEETKTDKR